MRITRWNEKDLMTVVRECARNETIVAECNRLHDTHLAAPIVQLLDPTKLPDPNSQTAAEIVCFIGFVHHTVWQSLLRMRRVHCQRVAASGSREHRQGLSASQ